MLKLRRRRLKKNKQTTAYTLISGARQPFAFSCLVHVLAFSSQLWSAQCVTSSKRSSKLMVRKKTQSSIELLLEHMGAGDPSDEIKTWGLTRAWSKLKVLM